ncbi:anti-sigma factor family protein [Promicromonospora aerolata]|uniref:Anti-sigma factor family protein n=1 Tax=Promicromonospora aerolata TaxID=195749 RepID=A0ABW4V4S1_9MICO
MAKVLQSYLDGEAEPATSSVVASHLETCRRCGLEAETYLAIKAALAVGSERPPPVDPEAVDRLKRFADGLSAR